MAPKPLYNWWDWWNTRRSSWGSIRERARAQTSWGNARGGAPAGNNVEATAIGTMTAATSDLINGLSHQNTSLRDNGGPANGGSDTPNPSSTINVVAFNEAPLLGSLNGINLLDTSAQDSFSARSGSLSATDPEGASLSYGLEGAVAAAASFEGISYDLSKAGVYGTLYLNSSTGQYRFQLAGDFALNAISASGSESFVFTSSDGSLTSSTPLLLTFSAADDTPVQYVVVNDGLPVLSAAAASLWDQALTQASAYLAELLTRADRDTLLNEVFGRAGTEATVFEANKQALLEAIGTTGLRIAIDLRSGTEMGGAIGAYAQMGHNGNEHIYINADWINAGNLSLEQLTAVLLEEYGHALDVRLNPGLESAGDEGELFANLITNAGLDADQIAAINTQNDWGTVQVDGQTVMVEQAVSSVAISTTATTTLNKISGSLSYRVNININSSAGADVLVAAYASNGTLIGWQVVNRNANLRNTSYTGAFGFNAVGLSTVDTASITLRAWQGTAGSNYGTASDVSPAITYGIGNLAAGAASGFTVNQTTAPATGFGAISFTGTVTGGSQVSGSSLFGVDTIAPTVSDARISISGATGTGGAYKIGDVVTATWNNTAGGDNNTDTISGVTVNFSAFGGGAAVAATNSSGTWTATYTIVSGSIDATNRNVSVTATDNAGNSTTTADTTNATVDNSAPTSSVGSQSVQLVEAGSSGAGTDTASRTLSLSGGAYSTDYLTANGWTAVTPSPVTTANANGSGYSYEIKNGQAAAQSFTITGSGTYAPSALLLAIARETADAGARDLPMKVEIATASSGGTVLFEWSGTGATFPQNASKDAIDTRTSVTLTRLNNATLTFGTQYFIRVSSTGSYGKVYWSGSSSNLTGLLAGNTFENGGSQPSKDFEYQLTYASDSTSYTKTGTYGAATLNTITGAVSYTLNNSDADTKTLAASTSVSDSFTIRAVDSAGNNTDTPVSFAITGSNDAPDLTAVSSGSLTDTSANDSFNAITGTLAGSDVDAGTTLTYGITGGTVSAGTSTRTGTYGSLSVNTSTGAYIYTPNATAINALSANATDTFSFSVSDGAGGSNATGFTINITGVNDTPVITSSSSATFAENATGTVYIATGSDSDSNSTLSYSLAGTDAALFNINSSNGAVTFKSAPNFEAPADAGANNVYDITVTASDGSLSSAAQAVAITVTDVDDTAPNAPVITSITDDIAPLTGTVSNGGITNDTVLLLNGTAEANSTIQLFNGSASFGSTSANGSGTWTFTTATLINGSTYSFNATATDAAGNVSAASANYTVTVDTSPPASLTLTLGSGLSDGATAAEATAATGAVSVVAEAGTNVAVSFSRSQGGSVTKNLIGSGAAQAVVLNTADLATLGDGVINVSALASDGGGNSSDQSTATFTLNTSAPLAPSLALQSDTGRSSRDGITSNAAVLVGRLESGAVWEYSTNAGDSWTGGSGSSFGLAAGSYDPVKVLVRQRNSAGSLSATTANSRTWVVDTTAPQVLSSGTAIAIAENSGANQLIYTPQMAATELLTGSLLFYSLAGGPDASQFSVDTFSGAIRLLANPNYESQSSYSVVLRATDLAGLSTDQTVTLAILDVDEVAPLAPMFNSIGGDQRVNAQEAANGVVISGTAEGGSTVTTTWGFVSKTVSTSGSASGTGTWSTSFSLLDLPADGLSTITATARDAAGNRSATGSTSVELDQTTPGQPSLAPVAGNHRINAAEKTGGITLSGSAEAGASIAITWNGTTRTTTADASTGSWSLGYTSAEIPANSASSVITVTATDRAGNVSTPISRSVVIDTTPPVAPLINTVAGNDIANAAEKTAGITLSGTGEIGTTAAIIWDSFSATTTVNSSGIWTVVVPNGSVPADNAASSISVTLTDAAGNVSSAGTKSVRIDTVAPIAPVINPVAGDNLINAAEKAAGLTLSGTAAAENGSTVAITWGNVTRTAIVTAGAWSLGYTSAQIPADAASSTISTVVTDTAGNTSGPGTRNVVIDTVAPGLTIASLRFGEAVTGGGSTDTGTIKNDFITSTGLQTLNGTLSAALGATDTVWVRLNSGGTTGSWTQASATGTSFSASLNLGAADNSGSFDVQVRDGSGNPGATRNQTYRLDTTPAGVTISTFALSADTGISATDRITSSLTQTFSGTLSTNIAAGESVFYSLNGGTWTQASTTTGRNTWSFTGTLVTANGGANSIAVRHQDIAGNASAVSSFNVTYDATAPTLSSLVLASGGADNLYGRGDVVTVTATFSESVLITGTPRVALNVGGVTRYATYTAGNNSNSLTFSYTVVAGDTDADGISLAANALQLNQGTIRDAAGTNALITATARADQANAAVDDSVSFTELCQVSGTNIQLDSITNHARLQGLENAALVGNAGNNVLTGNAGNNSITGGLGRDILTGGLGADRFLFNQPKDSQLGSGTTGMDWIRDFEIGTDTVVSPWGSEVQQASLAGSVTKLTGASVTQLLDATTFSANVSAAAFMLADTITTRTFLALNNGVGGFDASADVLLEITGYQGMLSF